MSKRKASNEDSGVKKKKTKNSIVILNEAKNAEKNKRLFVSEEEED